MKRENGDPKGSQGDFIEVIRNTIESAREKIDAEFMHTDNDWFSCFVKRLTVLNGDLQLARMNKLIDEDEYPKLNERYERAYSKLRDYRSRYPNLRRNLPLESIREDLISSLDIFRAE